MDPVPNPAEAPDSGQEPARAGLQEEISPYIPVARIPRSTYRLQFSGRFTFRDAEALVAYLDDLGIGSCYASPLLRTPPGSSNGYDICDHSQFDPRLGTDQDFEAFSRSLRDRHMGLVVDIVPNHMGIGDPCNAWWMDVLENGPSSTYADYFDITWDPVKPELENKVLLPILEDQYGNVLESGKLRLAYEDGSLLLNYHQRVLPLAPRTYSLVLTSALDWLVSQLGIDDPAASDNPALLELQSILTALGYLPPRTEQDPSRIAERNRERQVIKRRIAGLYETSPDFRRALDETIAAFNGTPGQPRSFDRLDALVEAQAYRPAFWRVAAEEINYRRFFDINDMAAIRVELPEVFAAAHDLYLRLLAAGRITGARVDHPDGLWNPAEYFHKLQCEYVVRAVQEQQPELDRQELEHVIERRLDEILAARAVPGSPSPPLPLYVVAEKILSETEPLPRGWAVYGTTGYDFMNAVNGIYVDGDNEKAFNKIYSHFVGHSVSYPEVVYAAKRGIMRGSLSSEINSLAHQLERLAEKNRHYRDFTLDSITIALREVIAGLGIYRTYVDVERRAVSRRDETYLTAAVDKARRRNPAIPGSIFDFVRDTLLLRNFDDFPEPDRPAVAHFIMRFQQMTSPVMAKGVEDTAFYIYDRLVSLNEVGGNPAQFGLPLAAFHRHNSEIRRDWPHTLLATSTHDTKRSEDVRARINVLSEMPDEWRKNLARWRRINQAKKMMVDGEPAPDHDDEYLLYQTLLGAFPVGTSRAEFADFRERIASYMQKASKEAKVHTSWVSPNAGYDEAIRNFV
ncbi:MAG: malto-oligosyltrehalose synthase, partial [Rudaea sp.]